MLQPHEQREKTGFWIKLGYSLLLLPFLEPASVPHIAPSWVSVLNIWYGIALGFIAILYLIHVIQKGQIERFILLIAFYYFTLVISTIYNNGSIENLINAMVKVLGFCILVELMLHKNPLFCFDVMLFPLEALVYLNLLTVFLFPNGMYRVQIETWHSNTGFLLGNDNMAFPTILLTNIIELLRMHYDSYRSKWRALRFALLFGASLATILITWSATSVIGILLFALIIFFPRMFAKTQIFNAGNYTVFTFLFFFVIVIFRMQDMMAFIIEDFLGKNLTFTGRTYIWDRSIFYIQRKPLLGAGNEMPHILFTKLGQINSHNEYLWALYRGGITHFIVFASIIIISVSRLMKWRDSKAAQIVAWALFIIMLIWQTTIYDSMHLLFMMFILAIHIDTIDRDAQGEI